MAQYDGEIRIKTKIDETGAKAGVKSLKSQAMTLAAQYRKAGMDQSAAMKKAWSEIERQSKKSSKSVLTDVNSITDAFKSIGALALGAFSLKAAIDYMKEASTAAIQLESSMIRTSEIFGDSNEQIVKFAENTAIGLGMSQKMAYEYAATYGNLFSMLAGSQKENANLTLKYLNASAVVASKTGRTMQDVMERVRSGILGNTEAIEDLGINVNVAMLEMTDAFQRIADGKSWEKLNFQQQQEIRTLAILEQAHKKYGDEVTNSSAFATQRYAAAMENLKVTLGGFINLAIVPVMNALTSLAVLLNNVLTAMFGQTIKTQAQLAQTGNKAAAGQSNLADKTNKAAKAAKNTLATFDELNILQKDLASDKGSSAGAGAAGSVFGAELKVDTTKIETEKFKVPEGLEDFIKAIEELKEALKVLAIDANNLWETEGVQEFVKMAASLFLTKIVEYFTGNIIKLSGALEILSGLIQFTSGMISGDFAMSLEGSRKVVEGVNQFIRGAAIQLFGADLVNAVSGFINFWNTAIGTWFVENVVVWFSVERWYKLLTGVKTGITQGWKTVTDWWAIGGATMWFNTAVKPWFTKEKWSELWVNVKTSFINKWTDIVTWWNKNGPTVWWSEYVKPWFTYTKWSEMLVNVKNAFVGIFSSIGTAIQNIMKSAVNNVIDTLNTAINAINQFKVDIPDWIPEFGGQSIGFNIPKIPRLAKGAVIQPNKPFLAELGDQQSGINIETPLETMVDAFKEALSTMNTSGGGDVVMVIDGKEIGRAVQPHVKSAEKRIGASLVMG